LASQNLEDGDDDDHDGFHGDDGDDGVDEGNDGDDGDDAGDDSDGDGSPLVVGFIPLLLVNCTPKFSLCIALVLTTSFLPAT
jgi:hypothetical protein